MKEKWKELEGNREIYLISDQGNIRTKTRPGARGTIVQGHSLTTHENSSGYLRAGIHLKGEPKGKSYFVHRLVAEKFVPNYDNKPFINHKDGNKHNNSAKNLEWCTRSENEKHAWKTGLKKKDIVIEGANVDYLITKGLLIVASDKYAKFPERRITIPVNRVLMVEEEN